MAELKSFQVYKACEYFEVILYGEMQIKWNSDSEPSKGFQYLYLSEDDYHSYRDRCGPGESLPFKAERVVTDDGDVHWRLSDIIGREDGLGVECLSGSAATASAFSRAYREGFTITLVSGRTVGIGAYLARLGRRYAPLKYIIISIAQVKFYTTDAFVNTSTCLLHGTKLLIFILYKNYILDQNIQKNNNENRSNAPHA